MGYNFVRKIKQKEFSLKKDLEQSAERTSNLMYKLSPVYKKIGLEKLVKLSEKTLGELDEKSRAQVETGYASGTLILGLGIITGNPVFYVLTGGFYCLSLLHHSAMKKTK